MAVSNNPPIKLCPNCYTGAYKAVKVCYWCGFIFHSNGELVQRVGREIRQTDGKALIIDHAPEPKRIPKCPD